MAWYFVSCYEFGPPLILGGEVGALPRFGKKLQNFHTKWFSPKVI
jgi:hypothetical protein